LKQQLEYRRDNSGIKIFKDHYKHLDLGNIKPDRNVFHRIKRIDMPDSQRTMKPELGVNIK
jgi:hypothetical protein